jgi:cyclopropane fatty-acyl-phospholipid synthase-like methyltransferase
MRPALSAVDNHEEAVRNFYADDGEAAALAYDELMGQEGQKGRMWFHGDRLVLKATGSPHEARLAMLRWMADQAELTAGSWVLEFGSGSGGAAVELAAMTGAQISGCSNVESNNRRARLLADDRGMSGRVTFTTIGNLDYKHLAAWPAGCFDAVAFNESLCHLPDRGAFFRAAHRVLRPGGWLVGTDWIQRPYGEYQSPQRIATLTDPVVESYHLASLGTVDSYAQQIGDAGFSVEIAVDEYPKPLLCLDFTETQETWSAYVGPSADLHNRGKKALDLARAAGVFSVARWAATRPRQ